MINNCPNKSITKPVSEKINDQDSDILVIK